MKLPTPRHDGEISVERTIKERRTIRAFLSKPLRQNQFSQLLWATQGITEKRGHLRAAASAGALYPMDLYAVTGQDTVEGIKPGMYHYEVKGHSVTLLLEGDLRKELANASLYQTWMAEAPVNFLITAEYRRITAKYGERGIRYALIEAGHMGQNIFLQAEGLGLGAGIVGAFRDEAVVQVTGIPPSHEPILIMPVGYKR
jgi:SagB-type dehydrogenase family enzyme